MSFSSSDSAISQCFRTTLTTGLPESKTDVYREGQDVFIHKSGNFTCPYRLLLRYLDSANITISMSPEVLFRNVVFLKSVGKYDCFGR